MRTDEQWYVVWVQTGAEEEIYRKIRAIPGIGRALMPTQRLWYRAGGAWTRKEKPLIPSYLFIRCDMTSGIYHAIRQTPKVLGWLGKDGYWPEIVPDAQMEPVLALAAGGDPAALLQGVTIDRHKRKGRGALRLIGTEQIIAFAVDPIDKQPEDAQVDQCPAAEPGDHSPGA